MRHEIKIILEKTVNNSDNYEKGNCFENLIRDILDTQRYTVTQNINFAGMEIDLLAKHKDQKDEVLYVECKAKEKVQSTEIKSFLTNVDLNDADFGYFISTKELDHQVGGLIEKIESKEKYSNITFFKPEQIIDILKDNKTIKNIDISYFEGQVTKQILVVSYFGDFLAYIIKRHLALPTHFYLFDAKTGYEVEDKSIIDSLQESVTEIAELHNVKSYKKKQIQEIPEEDKKIFETISEVQESENWYDYLPASYKHFVGRDDINNQLFGFINKIVDQGTNRRVFYLTGKSGWGKSSLIASFRGRCRNKYYKNKFFATAIDSRSALSPNFVALGVEKIFNNAVKEGFITKDLFNQGINFTSNEDLLSSESIRTLLNYLEKHNKYLILIFDQFEDIFRQSHIFKSFYKLLLDVNDYKSNLIIGFSWKTEILIPPDNNSYHLWQQSKELSERFEITEFGSKEINGIINQLEKSIGKIQIDLKRRLIESSQGYPWLTKKLCIHIYDQVVRKNHKIENLIEENLNIETLFQNDLEKLDPEEVKGLRYIAKKSYEGAFFDSSEINDTISESVINSLIHNRLIVKSGLNYNVYWDIFRDYLVTDEVPIISESYILRQSANLCSEVFLLFKARKKLSVKEIQSLHPRNIKTYTLENILSELRSIGILKKEYGIDEYSLQDENMEVTPESFSQYVTSKLQSHTLYLKLSASQSEVIRIPEIVKTLKETFKGYDYKNTTWQTYAKSLINWFNYTSLPIKNRLTELQKGRRPAKIEKLDNLILRTSPKELKKGLRAFKADPLNYSNNSVLRDLNVLDLIDNEKRLSKKGYELVHFNEKELDKELTKMCLELPAMKKAYNIYSKSRPKRTDDFLVLLPEYLFTGIKQSSKKIYASKLRNWSKFNLENNGDSI